MVRKFFLLFAIPALALAAFAQENHPSTSAAGALVGKGAIAVQASSRLPNMVVVTVRRADGSIKEQRTQHNLRTNAGADWQSKVMGDTAAQPASCNYIAVSNDSTTPVATDTTLAGEINASGIARAQGTFSHTDGTTSYTISKTWSASGTVVSQKTGLFTAASSGTMCAAAMYTGGSVSVGNGETLTVTWTWNL